jgi:hypothetical protein
MTEEIQQLLKNLRLRKMAEIMEGELAAARKTSPSYTDLLARLLRAEWLDQQERRLQSRIKHANLPEQWTLESFPFKQQPGVSRRQIRELAELEFIPKAVNVVFIGPTGVGKTGLASGLLLKALQNGYRGLFIRAQDLFDEMYASIADRASRKLIRRWAGCSGGICNGLGIHFPPGWACVLVLAGKRTPKVRLGGRSAQETTVNVVMMMGAMRFTTLSPFAACDAAAPVISKKAPAYAHSLSRAKRGASKAMVASSFQKPRMVRRYTGYPRCVTTCTTCD